MRPFSSIQSRNFNTLLLLARVIAVFALLLFFGATATALWVSVTGAAFQTVAILPIAIWSIFLFIFSGIVAVLISIEEHLRAQRTRDVSNVDM
ncbi:hypothetical protein [Alteromonas facilis]|uniref:hypothetical protein n=1 Tax=Alteromonas facilis TaxID=2048004 RepID=UPI000C294C2A|nr:hypothetical protein [Alteromonas facilis]